MDQTMWLFLSTRQTTNLIMNKKPLRQTTMNLMMTNKPLGQRLKLKHLYRFHKLRFVLFGIDLETKRAGC